MRIWKVMERKMIQESKSKGKSLVSALNDPWCATMQDEYSTLIKKRYMEIGT